MVLLIFVLLKLVLSFCLEKVALYIVNKIWGFFSDKLERFNKYLVKKMAAYFYSYALEYSAAWFKCKWNKFVNLFKSDSDVVKVPIKLVLGNVIQLADQKFLAENDNTIGILYGTALGKATTRWWGKEIPFDYDVIEEAKLYARPLGSAKDVPYKECIKANAPIDINCEYLLLIELFDHLFEDQADANENDLQIRPVVLLKEKYFAGKSEEEIWKIFKRRGWYLRRPTERAFGYVWAELEEKKKNSGFLAPLDLEKDQRKRQEQFLELQRQINEKLERECSYRKKTRPKTLPLGLDDHHNCFLEIVHSPTHSTIHSLPFRKDSKKQTLEQLIISHGNYAMADEFEDVREMMKSSNASFYEFVLATGDFVKIGRERPIRAKHWYKLDITETNVSERNEEPEAKVNAINSINLVLAMIPILLFSSIFIKQLTGTLPMASFNNENIIYFQLFCCILNLPFLLSSAFVFICLLILRHFHHSGNENNVNEESTSVADQTVAIGLQSDIGISRNICTPFIRERNNCESNSLETEKEENDLEMEEEEEKENGNNQQQQHEENVDDDECQQMNVNLTGRMDGMVLQFENLSHQIDEKETTNSGTLTDLSNRPDGMQEKQTNESGILTNLSERITNLEDRTKFDVINMDGNKWAQCGSKMAISGGGLIVKHSGPNESNSVRAQMAIPKIKLNFNKSAIAYFEVEIVTNRPYTHGIDIGYCTQQFPLEGNWLGDMENSIGIWHKGGLRIDGISFGNGGGFFHAGEVIGIGIVHFPANSSMKCFASCNGNLLGKADLPIKFANLELFPAVTMFHANHSIRANFGSDPWKYNPTPEHLAN